MSRSVPIRDTWNVCNLDDVARSAEYAGCNGSSRSRGCSVGSHGSESSNIALLLSNIILLPFFRLEFLLFSSLLDPESPQQKHDDTHKHYTTNNASRNCSYIWTIALRGGIRVCNAFGMCAVVAILRHQGTDLAVRARSTGRCFRRTLHTSLEDCSHCSFHL